MSAAIEATGQMREIAAISKDATLLAKLLFVACDAIDRQDDLLTQALAVPVIAMGVGNSASKAGADDQSTAIAESAPAATHGHVVDASSE